MGFLKNFSEPFAFALALWPFVSMLLTVPVLLRGRTYRWQGAALLALYAFFCGMQFV